jgi:hypothetical protein
MFALCSAMKWAHLPIEGGIYAQNIEMMDKFRYIFQEQGKEAERERKASERQSKNPRGMAGSRRH